MERLGLYTLNIANDPEYVGCNQIQRMTRERAEELMQLLEYNVQQIQRNEEISLTYNAMYRHIYSLNLHKYGRVLYTRINETIAQLVESNVKHKIISNLNGNFLRTLNNEWIEYKTFIRKVKSIMIYMDRVHGSHSEMGNINSCGLDIFRSRLLGHEQIQRHLTETLLNLVRLERHGENIDRAAFRAATDMLTSLGNNDKKLYRECFEQPFLEESLEFFTAEGEMLLIGVNVPTLLTRIEKHIIEESDRSAHCYNEMTTPRIVEILESVLIIPHMEAIVNSDTGVAYMLENKLIQDLARMYRLYSRVPDSLNVLYQGLTDFVQSTMETIINENYGQAVRCIQSLVNLKDDFNFIVNHSFSNDTVCQHVLIKALTNILNRNVTLLNYMAIFINHIMKKSRPGITEGEKRTLLEKTMTIFQYIKDKDLFENNYKQCLAKRLVTSSAINDLELEKSILLKLAEECGSQYTRKMQAMIRDVETSETITKEFYDYVNDKGIVTGGVELRMKVLRTGFWPIEMFPCPLPNEKDYETLPTPVLSVFQSFKMFYQSKHCGRKLALLPQLGSAEIKAYFDPSNTRDSRSYLITNVNTLQMCILMLFNTRTHWSFQELQTEINISERLLQKSLLPLIQGQGDQRLVMKTFTSDEIDQSDIFYINNDFISNRSKVKLRHVRIKEESERLEPVKVFCGSEFEVDAAIIRIIKARTVISHDDLLTSLVTALQRRFVPSKEMVKKELKC